LVVTVNRADAYTNLKNKLTYYSDFTNNFNQTPFGKNLALITNEQDVSQSIRNLVFTNYGERFFQPSLGCNVTGSLFELSGIPLINLLRDSITATITSNEPRCFLQNVIVQDPDSVNSLTTPASSDKNGLEVTIKYSLINNPNPITLTLFLTKIR
jgi:phage baseplate assembly protein W